MADKKQILKEGADYQGQTLGSYENEQGELEVSPIEIDESGYTIVNTSKFSIMGLIVGTINTLKSILVDSLGYIIPIEYLHHIIHLKKMRLVSYIFEDVGVGSSVTILIQANGNDIHIPVVAYNGELKIRFKSYDNLSNITLGTPMNSVNRVVGYLNGELTATITRGSTATIKSIRADEFVGANAAVSKAGGGNANGIETVVPSGQAILLEFTNLGSQTQWIGVSINMYERPANILS